MKKYGLFFCVITCVLVWVYLLSGWTYTYDTDTPVGTDAPSVIDDRIREAKDAIQERLNVEHVFDLTGSQVSHADSGKHTDITCTSVTSTGAISGTTITGSGAISGTTISGSNDLAINTDKFTVTAATGNTTVAGTFTSTGVATLADASVLASSAAPVNDADISNKKYVDDQITAALPDDDAFGSWATSPSGYATNVLAASDGFVVAMTTTSNAAVTGYTDGNNPPTTKRCANTHATGSQVSSIIMPVKKGNRWKVTGSTSRFWIPIGG